MQLPFPFRLGDVPPPTPDDFVGTISRRGRPPRPNPRARREILNRRLRPAALFDTPEGLRLRGLGPREVWDGRYAATAEPDGTILVQRPLRLRPCLRKELKLILYEQAKQEAPPTPPVDWVATAVTTRGFSSEADMWRELYASRSLAQVATLIGVTAPTVRVRLIACGIPLRSPGFLGRRELEAAKKENNGR